MRHRSTGDFDPRACSAAVRARALEANRDSRRRSIIAIHQSGPIHAIDDDIQIAVVIQIGQGHALRHLCGVESPCCRNIFKSQIAPVAVGVIGRREARHDPPQLQKFLFRQCALRFDRINLPSGIGVAQTPLEAGCDEQILISVQIHIQKGGHPRPVRSLQTGQLRNFGIGPVAAIEVEHVAHNLLPDFKLPRRQDAPTIEHLRVTDGMVAAEHVGDKEIVQPVTVDICKINPHRGEARLSHRQAWHRAKSAVAIIEPDSVRRVRVVTHVNVRRTVAVHVAKHDRQAPIQRRGGELLAIFIQEGAAGP